MWVVKKGNADGLFKEQTNIRSMSWYLNQILYQDKINQHPRLREEYRGLTPADLKPFDQFTCKRKSDRQSLTIEAGPGNIQLNQALLNEPPSRHTTDTCFPAENLGVSLWRTIEETIDKMDALNYKNRDKGKSQSSLAIRSGKHTISGSKKSRTDKVSSREKWVINRSGVRISDVSELINHLDKTLNNLVLAQTDKVCNQDFKEDICFYIISKIENPHIIIVLNQLQLVMENVDLIGMYKCFVTKFANDRFMLEKWGEAFVLSENA
jgi:hypothetical protein